MSPTSLSADRPGEVFCSATASFVSSLCLPLQFQGLLSHTLVDISWVCAYRNSASSAVIGEPWIQLSTRWGNSSGIFTWIIALFTALMALLFSMTSCRRDHKGPGHRARIDASDRVPQICRKRSRVVWRYVRHYRIDTCHSQVFLPAIIH